MRSSTEPQRSVARRFWLLSLCFGVGYAIITPPFAGSDELEHFARAYTLSEGSVRLPIDGEGRFVELPAVFSTYRERYGTVIRGIHDRARLRAIGRDLTSQASLRESARVPLSAAHAGAIGYAPQLPALWLARALGLPALWFLYLCRFASVLAFSGLTAWALSQVGALAWGWLALALTPALLAQAASASPQGTTIGLSFLFFAWVFRGSFLQATALSPRQRTALFGVFALLVWCNPLCLSFALSFAELPLRDRQTTRQRWAHVAAAFALGVATMLVSCAIAEGGSCLCMEARSAAQLAWIASHPSAALRAFLTGVFLDSTEYASQLLMVRDVLSKQMRFSAGLIATFYAQLLLFLTLGAAHVLLARGPAHFDARPELAPRARKAGTWLHATMFAFVGSALLSTYLSANELGAARLSGVHGELFFAAAPAASIALASLGRPIAQRWLLRHDGVRVRYAVIAVHVLWLIVLFGRYYAAPTWPYAF